MSNQHDSLQLARAAANNAAANLNADCADVGNAWATLAIAHAAIAALEAQEDA